MFAIRYLLFILLCLTAPAADSASARDEGRTRSCMSDTTATLALLRTQIGTMCMNGPKCEAILNKVSVNDLELNLMATDFWRNFMGKIWLDTIDNSGYGAQLWAQPQGQPGDIAFLTGLAEMEHKNTELERARMTEHARTAQGNWDNRFVRFVMSVKADLHEFRSCLATARIPIAPATTPPATSQPVAKPPTPVAPSELWKVDAKKCLEGGVPFDERLAACNSKLLVGNFPPAHILTFRANVLYRNGDYDRAIADITEAIRLDSRIVLTHYNRGLAWAKKGENERAIADYNEEIRLHPAYAEKARARIAELQASNAAPNDRSKVIASNGRSAMSCVKLVAIASGDSKIGSGGAVLSNGCEDAVEVIWCYVAGDCRNNTGAQTTLQPGTSWPVSAGKEIRWGACHGVNTVFFETGSFGLGVICKAPAGQ